MRARSTMAARPDLARRALAPTARWLATVAVTALAVACQEPIFVDPDGGTGAQTSTGGGGADGGPCTGAGCSNPGCKNGSKDGDETDTDCGGSCGPCDNGSACSEASDCKSGTCATTGKCRACVTAFDCASGDCQGGVCAPK